MKKAAKRVLISLVTLLIGAYIALFLFAVFFSDGVLYQPHPAGYTAVPPYFMIPGKEGPLAAVYLHNPAAKFTVLYFHGNAEDIGDLQPYFADLQRAGFNVLSVDYAGYGLSTGKPSERELYNDGTAAYKYLTVHERLAANKIIIIGHSLGAAVAIDLASRVPAAGLVSESGFVSVFRVITHYPLIPFDRFKNIDKIRSVHCPVLIIHGRDDQVIGFWNSEALYAAAKQPKSKLWIAGAGHNDIAVVSRTQYFNAIKAFADSLPSL